MTIQEALTYLHDVSWRGSRLGLSRTRELLRRLGDPQKRLRFVHVAGTNGKGSTSAMLAAILRAAGARTGLYTSPFLMRFNERMQCDGVPISDEALAALTERTRAEAEAMAEHPTEFELITALAMLWFAQERCDIVVLEVGLGGALDSTNVIDCPELAVICNLGYDHTAILGGTLAQIAGAKAGILKGGDCVLYDGLPQEAADVIRARCAATGTHLHTPDFTQLHTVRLALTGQVFDYGARKALELPLLGLHQQKNAAVVLTAVDVLRQRGWALPEEAVRRGLAGTVWPGRFELLQTQPPVFVDGGHNPQCMQALAQNLRDYLPGRSITALTGVMADKQYDEMYRIIAPLIDRFVAVTPDNPRALPAAQLAAQLRAYGKPVTVCGSVAEGVRAALDRTPDDGALVAFGSLYMAGDVRACFGRS